MKIILRTVCKSIVTFGFVFTLLSSFFTSNSRAGAIVSPKNDYPSQTYRYVIELTIPKSRLGSIFPLNKIAKSKVSVSIPADWPGQDLYIDTTSTKVAAMQFGQPDTKNQNLIFFVPIDKEQKITITGYEVINPVNLDLLPNIKINYQKATVDQEQSYTLYKNPTPLIESDNSEIVETAKEIKGNKTKVSDIISATYNFVVDRINYNYLSYDLIEQGKFVQLQSAVETLNKGSGICGDYSRLMIALLRAQGIPARMVIGAVDTGQQIGDSSPLHAWVQAYVPNLGFIDIDPTWGEDGNKYISDLDMDHVRLQYETPENQNNESITDYFTNFYFLDYDSLIYDLKQNNFTYSIKFTKAEKPFDNSDALDVAALAPVFISPTGFVNPFKNTVVYILSSIFLNPVLLSIELPALLLFAILLILIFHKKRGHNKSKKVNIRKR
jgi:transglutaminase-like putative cysteine protease